MPHLIFACTILLSCTIFVMPAQGAVTTTGKALQSGADVRVLTNSGKIATLFEIYGFGQETYYNQEWKGTLIERRHSMVFVRDEIEGPARVAVLICGGGRTTGAGCKGLTAQYKASDADIIIVVAPNTTLIEALEGSLTGAAATVVRDQIEGMQFAAPKFISEGPKIEAKLWALISGTPESGATTYTWQRQHSDINDKVIKWISVGVFKRLFGALRPTGPYHNDDFSGQAAIDAVREELEFSAHFSNVVANERGLKPKPMEFQFDLGEGLKPRLAPADARGGIALDLDVSSSPSDLSGFAASIRRGSPKGLAVDIQLNQYPEREIP